MNKKHALKLLSQITRNYDLARRAFERATTRQRMGHTTRCLEEQDKAFAYIQSAVDAEFELRELILNS